MYKKVTQKTRGLCHKKQYHNYICDECGSIAPVIYSDIYSKEKKWICQECNFKFEKSKND